MEVPPETSVEALRLAKVHGAFSILNPAPAPQEGLDPVRKCVLGILAESVTEEREGRREEGRDFPSLLFSFSNK